MNLEGFELVCPERLHLVEPRLQGDERSRAQPVHAKTRVSLFLLSVFGNSSSLPAHTEKTSPILLTFGKVPSLPHAFSSEGCRSLHAAWRQLFLCSLYLVAQPVGESAKTVWHRILSGEAF